MKKVVIIINRFAVGGAERLVVDDINEMHRRGVAVILITLRPERATSLQHELDIPKENWRIIPFGGLFDVRSWLRLVKELKGLKPDAVITHLWFSNTVGRVAAYAARVPTVITFEHNVYTSVKSQKQFLVDRLLQRMSTKIVAVSEAVARSLVTHGIKEEKITVLLNAVDIKRYAHAAPSGVRGELGLSADTFVFLSVGRLTRQKGMDILLRAFAEVSEGVLLIAGDGEERAALQGLAQELNIAKRAHFLGIRKDIPGLLRSSDCFVLLSRWEGLVMVVLEALAAGRVVVAADFMGIREIIEPEEDALVVPVEDSHAAAQAMQRIMIDRTLRERITLNTQRTSEEFSIQRHTDTLLSWI